MNASSTITAVPNGGASDTRPTLGAIRGAVVTVRDLDALERAYSGFLGYRTVHRGTVAGDMARGWDAPGMAGRRFFDLVPESGEHVALRLVEIEDVPPPAALTTHGWTALEFVVQDVDALAERLAGSPFRIIGPPASLTRFPMIRAMQVVGPAEECLYFTQIGEGSGLTLAAARSFVGRLFIAVAGGPDIAAIFAQYAFFGNEIDPPVSTPVRVISRANGLPDDTLHPHGLVRLPEGTLIEIDGYPPESRPRPQAQGLLPPGVAAVRFGIAALPDRPMAGPCWTERGHRIGCFLGAAGERIELEEDPA